MRGETRKFSVKYKIYSSGFIFNVAIGINTMRSQMRCYCRAYILQLIGGCLFADKSNSKVHLMFLPFLKDFNTAGTYSWGSACLAWLYRELCRASHIDACDISGPLIILQLWIWDRFPFIAPQRLYSVPLDRRLPPPPIGHTVYI